MEEHFTYEWIDSNFIVTFYGDISFIDIMNANGIMYGDRRFDELKYQIFDYSMITSINLNNNVPEIISKLDTAAIVWNHHVKVATVTKDDYLREKIDLYNKYLESTSWIPKTFDNIHDAIQWCKEV